MFLKRCICASFASVLFCISPFAQDSGLGGVSAEDLVRAALERNQEYLAARERVQEAEALIRQAGLRPVPTIEIEAGTGTVLGSRGESEYSAAYFRTIETAGKREKRIAIAEKSLALARAEVRERERQLTFQIKARFIDAATEELKLASVRALLPASEENYRLTVRRVELGDAAPLEQQLLLTEMNRAEARRISLTAASEATLLQLKSTVGATPADTIRIVPQFRTPELTPILESLQQAALEQRGDLQILKLNEEQAVVETELTEAEGRPDLTASARFTRSYSAFDQSGFSKSGVLAPLRDTDNVLTFGLSIPLVRSNRVRAASDAARSREQQQRLKREHLSRVIPQEVEAAYRRWSGAMHALEILKSGVLEPSQKNLTVIREAYRLGQLRFLDVLNEQRRLADLQLSYVEAQSEAARALAELELAVGGSLP